MRPLLTVVCLSLAGAVNAAVLTERSAYSIFNPAASGSARTVALGGAVGAIVDDYAATFTNPAGLAGLRGGGLDFGSDSNQADNFVVDLDDPKSRSLSVPLRYSYFGVRYITDSGWGIGFAQQAPFQDDSTFAGTTTRRVTGRRGSTTIVVAPSSDETETQLTANTYTLAVGRRLLDGKLGVGAALDFNRVVESFEFRPLGGSATFDRRITRDNVSGDFGAVARPVKWLQAGLVYKMGYRVGFDASLNRSLPQGTVFFHDVKMPDRFAASLAWLPHSKFSLFAQGDYVPGMRDTFVVGSGISPNSPESVVEAGRYATFAGRWGAEVIPIDEPDLTFKLWAGGYLENTGIQGGYSRYHRTAGFGLSPWFLSLSMAVDDTENYNNFVVGLGVDLLQASSRVAKRYGWKLPL